MGNREKAYIHGLIFLVHGLKYILEFRQISNTYRSFVSIPLVLVNWGVLFMSYFSRNSPKKPISSIPDYPTRYNMWNTLIKLLYTVPLLTTITVNIFLYWIFGHLYNTGLFLGCCEIIFKSLRKKTIYPLIKYLVKLFLKRRHSPMHFID